MLDADAVVVGGGFQGVMMALALIQRGRRPLVVERAHLGAGASAASLGIVHGGLRYLQTLDLPRWRRSRREQQWFGRSFGEHIAPIECMMPIYRRRLRSRGAFRAVFALENLAAAILGGDAGGSIVSPRFASSIYPIQQDGLIGGAVWKELALDDPSALLADAARRIEQAGGRVLEQAELKEIEISHGRVASASIVLRGKTQRVTAQAVMLCVGAQSRALAQRFDRDIPELSARTLAFNLLFDRPAVAGHMLAVSPVAGKGRSYFLREMSGRLLAGTYYAPIGSDVDTRDQLVVPVKLIAEFRRDLEMAAPWLAGAPITGVLAGALPDRYGDGKVLRAHDLAWDHGRNGGPEGLYTLLNTKLTTTHALAERVADLYLARQPTRARNDA